MGNIDRTSRIDFRTEDGKIEMQKELRRIKPLSKIPMDKEVEFAQLEKVIKIITTKYNIRPQWIEVNYALTGIVSCSFRRDDNYDWVGTVYAQGIYELYCKMCVLLWDQVQSGELSIREFTQEDLDRKKQLEKLRGN